MNFSARGFARVVFGWEPEARLSDTAWLNGIRGLAAFLVMMNHYSMAWLSAYAEAPFGARSMNDTALNDVWYFHKGQRLWAPWRLPIVRVLMCNGGGQVAIFFVLSGFVLTYGPLGLVQAGPDSYKKLFSSVGSSTLRRWLRLYLPCAIVTFAYVVREKIKRWEGLTELVRASGEYLIFVEIWANPFNTVAETVLSKIYGTNLVLWTIPHEFYGSVFVYVLLLTLGRIQNFRRRISVTILITLYAVFSLKWELWLFGTGMTLADYARHSKLFQKPAVVKSAWTTGLWTLCLVLGLLLLSFMADTEYFDRPGYEWMSDVPLPHNWRDKVGEDRFWWGCGAILVIAASLHLRLVQKFFELAFLQHLGKISFMLYLMHLLIGNMIGGEVKDIIYAAACTKERDETFGFEVCRINPWLNVSILISLWAMTVPVLLIVSHILERFVDRPVTRFGKWLDEKLLGGFSRREERLEEEERKEPELERLLEAQEYDETASEGSSETSRR